MDYEVIDLTFLIEEGMPTFAAAWHPKVSIDPLGTIEEVGRNTKVLQLGTHTGTHIDAPVHFIEKGSTIDGLSLSDLIGSVTLIDLRHIEGGSSIGAEDLKDKAFDKRVLLCFGWDKMWSSGRYYDGYPYLRQDAVEYLVDKGVKLLGLDTPSPDDSRVSPRDENNSSAHKYFLNNGVILLEYLCQIDRALKVQIDRMTGGSEREGPIHGAEDKWQLAALPLKIKGADGAPARVCLFRGNRDNQYK